MSFRMIKFGTFFSLLAAFFIFEASAQAGGAFSTTPAGDPVLWSGPVTYRLDPGGSEDTDSGGGGGGGCMINQAQATEIKGMNVGQMVRDAFAKWGALTSGITINEGPLLPENVTFANAENYYVGSFVIEPFVSSVTADPCYSGDSANCLNSVIFDPHGLITDAILGQCARYSVFGFASILPQTANDAQGTITSKNLKSAQMVVSGTCATPVDAPDSSCFGSGFGDRCPLEHDANSLLGVIVHEIGHYLGLDHTLVNKDIFLKCVELGSNCTADELEKIPTMIGLAVPDADLTTLTQDDISTFRGYYPEGGNNHCTIKGLAQDAFGNNGRCVEVVATKQGDPNYQVSFVSGAEVPRNSQGIDCRGDFGSYSSCLSSSGSANTYKVHTNCNKVDKTQCGEFELRGLDAGTYDIAIQAFEDNGSPFDQRFVLEPCTPPRFDNAISDNSTAKTNVVCPAGGTVDIGTIKSN